MSVTVPHPDLQRWCAIPVEELVDHPERRVPLRLCSHPAEMGRLMAQELVDEITRSAAEGRTLRTILPCGPSGWYAPFTELVSSRRVSLAHVEVFHMDECLDWQGKPIPRPTPTASAASWSALLRADPGRPQRARGQPALARTGAAG